MKHPALLDFAEVTRLEEAALKMASTMPPEHAAMMRRVVSVLTHHSVVLAEAKRLLERK